MEVYEAVRTVLAVRQFKDEPIHADAVHRILEAGQLTGSSMNGQPWRFIAVQDRDTLKKLGQIAKSGPYIAGAALAVVVAIERTPFAVSDASRAVQSMVLTAWADGVGSNWAGFFGLEGAKPVLNIPDDLDVLVIVPFGYPVASVGRGKKNRKPFGEVVHKERYGSPFV